MKYLHEEEVHTRHSSSKKTIIKLANSPRRRNSCSQSKPKTHNEGTSQLSSSSTQSCHYKFKVGQYVGHYRITRLLGDGTFGRVVEGEYGRKLYAIKIIRPVEKYVQSARTEKSILKAINLRDPNDVEGIARYKHSFTHMNHFCLVFKPLGHSLYDVLKLNEHRGFRLSAVQSYFRQILKTLSFLHRIGYTHTDLKPENILLEKEELQTQPNQGGDVYMPKSNRIRIIDFGGATRYDDYHSATICTRQYRPPEVILECCQWTEIADVWSVGCIIAELFTGELLFPAHSDQEHLLMIGKNSGAFPNWMIAKTPSSLRKLFKDGVLSEEEAERHIEDWSGIRNMPITADIFKDCSALRDLVGQCLQIDPNKRINCATALRHSFFQSRID